MGSNRSNDALKGIYELSRETYGNIIVYYAWWVLRKAQVQGVHRLYFLARDGYVLYEIAKIISRNCNIDIDCRYLYCSRQSLRIPAFHLMGEEMFEYIFMRAEKLTASVIMSRTGLSAERIHAVYEDVGFDIKNADILLSVSEYDVLCRKLRASTLFIEFVYSASREAYDNAVGYFIQEGLLDDISIGIVDSGWCGSMQRTLHMLLDTAGFKRRLTGFYFGLYRYPKDGCGDFLTFYFSPKSNPWKKVLFSNNLFECMLSAPHGMTMGYDTNGSIYGPVLQDCDGIDGDLIHNQINGITDLARSIDYSELACMKLSEIKKKCKRYIVQIMVKPTECEVNILAKFRFCDDCGDTYSAFLADKSQMSLLNSYLVFPRLLRKALRLRCDYSSVYWVYGVIAYLPKCKQWWYRLNVYAWDWLRYILK